MSPLAALEALGNPAKAAEAAAYHKAERRYLGVPLPAVEALVATWRAGADVPERVALAHSLWASDIHEARIAAAKLLTQARIGEDEALVWAELASWVPDFDAWAISDHACKAIERRLVAAPKRIDVVEEWTGDRHDLGAAGGAGGDAAVEQADPPDGGGARRSRARSRSGRRGT